MRSPCYLFFHKELLVHLLGFESQSNWSLVNISRLGILDDGSQSIEEEEEEGDEMRTRSAEVITVFLDQLLSLRLTLQLLGTLQSRRVLVVLGMWKLQTSTTCRVTVQRLVQHTQPQYPLAVSS
jgi:hypothetical protein